MNELALHGSLMIGFLVVAALVFPLLFFITAPYGRHTRRGWGPTVNNTLGWVLMESPSPLLFATFFLLGTQTGNPVNIVFLGLWLLHYINRTYIFPFRLRAAAKRMPLMIMLSGMTFNAFNAYLNSRWQNSLAPAYDLSWFTDPRFIGGVLLFLAGFMMNLNSDAILRNLRKPGETGYKIPRGGFFRFVSAPNYLGELIEWSGWALATWSLPGLAFLLWTAANLVPRAISNHKWYVSTFPDYPRERKAILPFIW